VQTRSSVRSRHDSLILQVAKLRGVEQRVRKLRDDADEEAKSFRKNSIAARKALIVIQKAAITTQEMVKVKVEKLVTFALRDVFGKDGYDFRVTIKHTKKALTADFFFVDNEGNEIEPMEGCGYGCTDVACFALRVVEMSINRTAPWLWLDEPFRNVSKMYRPNLVMMMKRLSQELGIQIVMATHMEELIEGADKHFTVGA